MLSKRLLNIPPSPVMALAEKAKILKSEGKDVISLSIGEPSWATPSSICSAGIRAIREGHTRYTPPGGSPELKKSIVSYTKKHLNMDIDISQVTVSIGAKFILFSALQALCDPGDEVLVPTPYWVSYPAMVELASAKLIPIQTTPEDHFKIRPDQLEKHITHRSKIFILNSPNNPTGSVLTTEELKALGQVLRKHPQIVVLSDDIYNHLYFLNPVAPHLLEVCPDLKDRVLCINAVSKNYSMTGWRVGWAVGPKDVIQAMSRFQSQSVSCASSISQEAARWALDHCDKEVEQMRQKLIKARDSALELFQNLDGLNVFSPDGTFYMWLGVQSLLSKQYKQSIISSSADFAQCLLESQSVLCVPGEAFGCPGYMRIHFAIDASQMIQASERIQHFISQLK